MITAQTAWPLCRRCFIQLNIRVLELEKNWNENKLNSLTRNNWRASLVPAAATFPVPIAYIKVVAVKKLIVGFWGGPTGAMRGEHWSAALPLRNPDGSLLQWSGSSGRLL